MMRCVVQGSGHALPQQRVPSDRIEQELGLPEGWIEKRTGIRERPLVAAEEATSDLAVRAARQALESAPAETPAVHGLILATSTPDHLLPPTAPRVAAELGLGPIMAFDMAVACSGFVYGLVTAQALALQARAPMLLIAANVLSKRVDPGDRGTRALFADAAGAVVLQPQAGDRGLLAWRLESQGEDWPCLQIPAGGSREPFDEQTWRQRRHLMQIQDGKKAFRYAVESMARCGLEVLRQHGASIADVAWWIPHQANQRILDEAQKRLGFRDEQVVSVVATTGNSSAATVPVACSMWRECGKLRPGDLVLLTAAGAGLTAGAALLRW